MLWLCDCTEKFPIPTDFWGEILKAQVTECDYYVSIEKMVCMRMICLSGFNLMQVCLSVHEWWL